MTIKRINPGTLAPPGGHYSHAVVAAGLVFISGQLPITPAGEKLNQSSFEDQTRQVLANVQAALEAAGSNVAQLVQVRVYVTDMAQWPVFNRIYQPWAGAAPPARAVVPVPLLHHGFAIEVEAVAALQPLPKQ